MPSRITNFIKQYKDLIVAISLTLSIAHLSIISVTKYGRILADPAYLFITCPILFSITCSLSSRDFHSNQRVSFKKSIALGIILGLTNHILTCSIGISVINIALRISAIITTLILTTPKLWKILLSNIDSEYTTPFFARLKQHSISIEIGLVFFATFLPFSPITIILFTLNALRSANYTYNILNHLADTSPSKQHELSLQIPLHLHYIFYTILLLPAPYLKESSAVLKSIVKPLMLSIFGATCLNTLHLNTASPPPIPPKRSVGSNNSNDSRENPENNSAQESLTFAA